MYGTFFSSSFFTSLSFGASPPSFSLSFSSSLLFLFFLSFLDFYKWFNLFCQDLLIGAKEPHPEETRKFTDTDLIAQQQTHSGSKLDFWKENRVDHHTSSLARSSPSVSFVFFFFFSFFFSILAALWNIPFINNLQCEILCWTTWSRHKLASKMHTNARRGCQFSTQATVVWWFGEHCLGRVIGHPQRPRHVPRCLTPSGRGDCRHFFFLLFIRQ